MENKRIYIKHIQILQINLRLNVTPLCQLNRYKESALEALLINLLSRY